MTDEPLWELLPSPQSLADRVLSTVRRRRSALAIALVVTALIGAAATVVLSRERAPAAGPRNELAAVYAAAVEHEHEVVYLPGLPAGVRRALQHRFGGRVRFAAAPVAVTRARPGVVLHDGRVDGDRARVDRDYLCGPLCGEGTRLLLARSAAGWRVTGTSGPNWVS